MKQVIRILIVILVFGISGCGKNMPNCPEGYIQDGESCVMLEPEDRELDFTLDNSVYEMQVDVNMEDRVITVEGNLYYRNDKLDMEELYVMMYPNAVPYQNEVNTEFEYLQINNEDVSYEFSEVDDEILIITPNETLNEGEFFKLSFKYEFHIWSMGRLSTDGTYLNAMYFYPIVAQYDGEWNLDEHSFMGEVLYTDLMDYEVEIAIPEEFIVASAGMKMSDFEREDRVVSVYHIEDARDFSFSASTDYNVYEREHNDRTYYIYSRKSISESELDYHYGYMFDTFDYLEENIGPYYYDYFTLELGDIYGMESSSIIYCSKDIGEITVIHEIVHQWFFFMIGNNQGDESWLDEGVTSYVTGIVFEEVFGTEAADTWYYPRYDAMNDDNLERYAFSAGLNVIQSVHNYVDYGYVVYRYGSTVLYEFVEQFLDGNHDVMIEALEAYYNLYEGENANIDTFLTLIADETGQPEAHAWLVDKLSSVQRLDE